ncbi:MAG TPA: MarR family transcriptional regulator [Acidobacteriaceae bacterium]|jgi:DNA-binding MarR family transcriptional regulator|nr:MarR family transcriptional regulator [Acidobacteriaceae bacterium]
MARKQEQDLLDLTQAIGLLVRRVRTAGRSHELSLTESAVMARLDREGPATTAELARAEGVKPQSMGATVVALEKRGMVARKPHATDGRQMMVALTAKGAAVRKSVKDAKHTWLAQAVTKLEKREQETLFRAGEIIRRLAEQ